MHDSAAHEIENRDHLHHAEPCAAANDRVIVYRVTTMREAIWALSSDGISAAFT
jgi:hypothetical protein